MVMISLSLNSAANIYVSRVSKAGRSPSLLEPLWCVRAVCCAAKKLPFCAVFSTVWILQNCTQFLMKMRCDENTNLFHPTSSIGK